MNLILVSSPTRLSWRIWYPTAPPMALPTSCATRAAVLVAATRLGCVTPTMPRLSGKSRQPKPASKKNWGTWEGWRGVGSELNGGPGRGWERRGEGFVAKRTGGSGRGGKGLAAN